MNPSRLDALSRALAGRTSRRRALGGIGGGGLGAGFLATLGLGLGLRSAAPVAAGRDEEDEEDDEDDRPPCFLDFVANVRLGPSSERRGTREITGRLRFRLDDEGALEDGELILDNGEDVRVQGQATGRAVTLRVPIEGGVLVAVGAGLNPVATCNPGEVLSGPSSGPQPGDLGDWRAEITCPDIAVDCDVECKDGERLTTACDCVEIGGAVCDMYCGAGQELTSDCTCVCLA